MLMYRGAVICSSGPSCLSGQPRIVPSIQAGHHASLLCLGKRREQCVVLRLKLGTLTHDVGPLEDDDGDSQSADILRKW
jgi:hypothetical protein